MNAIQIDRLNTLLIILSFWISFYFPFELFIVVYALLGPLHYLTQINWIRDRKYFTESNSWAIAVTVFAFIVTLPLLFPIFSTKPLLDKNILSFFQSHSITLLPIAFLIAFLLLSSYTKTFKISLFLGGLALILLTSLLPVYQLVIGVFLPTVIHVYFFTLIFMWQGAKRSDKSTAMFNVILMIALPLWLFIVKVDGTGYNSQNLLKDIFVENKFYALNAGISKILGFTDGSKFNFLDNIFVKIQIFITFAYTYHYLNWFSKTTVIGWHKQLTTRKSILILLMWLGAVGLYSYNYRAGVAMILFMSMLHVLMEFPLNIIAIRSAFGKQPTAKNTQSIH